MNYSLIYEQLVRRGQSRPTIEGYTESHHIIPRCMGGSDDLDNLVDLTPEEHYLAHQLLVKIYPDELGLVLACTAMCITKDKLTKVKNNKLYGWIKRKWHNDTRGKLTCPECGVEKEGPMWLIKKHTYCGPKCALKQRVRSEKLKYDKILSRECVMCGKHIRARWKNDPVKCCSKKCAIELRSVRSRSVTILCTES